MYFWIHRSMSTLTNQALNDLDLHPKELPPLILTILADASTTSSPLQISFLQRLKHLQRGAAPFQLWTLVSGEVTGKIYGICFWCRRAQTQSQMSQLKDSHRRYGRPAKTLVSHYHVIQVDRSEPDKPMIWHTIMQLHRQQQCHFG